MKYVSCSCSCTGCGIFVRFDRFFLTQPGTFFRNPEITTKKKKTSLMRASSSGRAHSTSTSIMLFVLGKAAPVTYRMGDPLR